MNSSTFPDLPRDAPTEDLVLSGQKLETIQYCHSLDVVDNNKPMQALPVIGSRSKASASLVPEALIRNLHQSASPGSARVTTIKGGFLLAWMASGALSAERQPSCRLVIAPNLRYLWDSYL